MQLTDGTKFFEILLIIAFLALLGASIYMIYTFYICDDQTCKPFDVAASKAPLGSREYVKSLLFELYNDGIWPMPYIGSAILTPLCLWLLGLPLNIKTFAILFFVSFVVIYFIFSFFGHHYIRPISTYVMSYVERSCDELPGVTISSNNVLSEFVCANDTEELPIIPIDIF